MVALGSCGLDGFVGARVIVLQLSYRIAFSLQPSHGYNSTSLWLPDPQMERFSCGEWPWDLTLTRVRAVNPKVSQLGQSPAAG